MNGEPDFAFFAPTPLVCPVTGELVDPADADSLIDHLENCTILSKTIQLFLHAVRRQIASLARAASENPDSTVHRLRGTRRIVKVTQPDVAFDQRSLRGLVMNYPPEIVSPVVVVDTYRVAMREYKKMAAQSGPPQFLAFRDALNAACRGRVGCPSVTIEDNLVPRQS